MKCREWDLNKNLLRGIDEAGFEEFMPVQEHTFKESFEGRDVLVQSKTGSGKTAAFLISIFQKFIMSDDPASKKALIIVPTRELAVQIENEAELLGKYIGIKCGSFFGGVNYIKQEKLLKENVQIIIGTPGRLMDFAASNKLKLNEIDVLVIDEADRLFDMGFLPDIRKILKKMKNKKDRQTMLFSATMNFKVRNLAWEYMNEPSEVTLSGDTLTVENVSQELYHVSRNEKFKLLLGLMKKINPTNAIIFANTKQSVFEVSQKLNVNGHKVQYIIGDLPQTKRLDVIKKLKSGELPFLVATDVAARGLHINDLELVINYDLPEDSENYVHRIGRTARVGKSGQAISFSCESYVYGLPEIEKLIGIKIPVMWPDENDFLEDLSEGMRFRFRDELSDKGDKKRERKNKEHKDKKDSKSRKKSKHSEKTELSESKLKSNQKFDKKLDKEQYSKDEKVKSAKQVKRKKGKKTSLEDRLSYYKTKYGENFIPEADYSLPKKDTLFSKIKKLSSVFKRKAK